MKEQFDTAGVRTTSRLLADNVSAADAPVVARLRAAGGIVLGKLNMTEFALGGTLDFPFDSRAIRGIGSTIRAARAPDRASPPRPRWPP